MKMMKTLVATAVLASSSAAMAEISGNVGLYSDYAFRGVSQTDEQIALQGGFDYAHDSGFYIGTWASNVNSDFFNDAQDPQLEVDVYAGFSGETAGGIGYDFGILHYDYPGADAADTDELYVSGSMAGFTLSLNYSDELSFVGSKESAYYIAAGYDYGLPQDVGLSLHVGLSDGDAFDPSKATGLPDSIVDWSIGVSKAVSGVDLGLSVVGSDADDDTFFGDLAETRVVFSVSKSM